MSCDIWQAVTDVNWLFSLVYYVRLFCLICCILCYHIFGEIKLYILLLHSKGLIISFNLYYILARNHAVMYSCATARLKALCVHYVRMWVDLSGFEPGQSAYVSSTRRHSVTAITVLLPPGSLGYVSSTRRHSVTAITMLSPPVTLLLLLLHVVRWCCRMSSATQQSSPALRGNVQ